MGLLISIVAILLPESRESLAWATGTVHGASELLTIAAMVSLPQTIPPAIAGGLLATRMLKRRPQLSRLAWIKRGVLCGSFLGVSWPAVNFGLNYFMTLRRLQYGPRMGDLMFLLSYFGFLGMLTGAIVGTLVGSYASRLGGRSLLLGSAE